MTYTTAQLTPLTTYGSAPANQNTGMATPNTSMSPRSPTCTIGLMVKAFQRLKDGKTARSSSASQNTGMATPNTSMSESSTSSRTTMPTKTTPSTRQPTSVIPQDMSCNGLPQCCMHVHQPTSQVCKPGESLALRKVKHPHNGKTSVSRFPLTKQDIITIFWLL